ncbi:MAG: 4-hydroxyphenylpyruvate dioxygenase [Gammaproteobacteria bacterium]
MAIENPMGTEGFGFLEVATHQPEKVDQQLKRLGFTPIAKHPTQHLTLYRQNKINFILNAEPKTHAHDFSTNHGDSISAMGFQVKDAKHAYERAIKMGAIASTSNISLTLPAIQGVGGSLIYFVDDDKFLEQFFTETLNEKSNCKPGGLTYIDHLTHNVRQGEMNKWCDFYINLFNFREIRHFDIHGQLTGLVSRAMTSPCNKIRIPINEATDSKSQIEEFITDFKGEGIQHVALGTDDIYQTVENLKHNEVEFLDTPDVYFKMIHDRVPWHKEDLKRLQADKILLDGTPTSEGGLLLQIFTQTMWGPVFFEIIQRKGNEGFGEGNFKALFEAIERDQIERGVL